MFVSPIIVLTDYFFNKLKEWKQSVKLPQRILGGRGISVAARYALAF